jgi:hypothetical protein
MITGTATRLAGKALGDFLKVGLPVIGSTVEQAVLNKLVEKYAPREVPIQGPLPRQYRKGASLGTATETPEAASSKIGQIVTKLGPENISKFAGAFAPFATVGAALAGTGLINKVLQGQENVYAQSQYSLPLRQSSTPVAFANQQYMPGMSPMTNQTVAEAMLEQQKFQHQLQLINARQFAQQGVGIAGRTTGSGLDIMGLSQQVFAPVQY